MESSLRIDQQSTLDQIIITDELKRRSLRRPNFESEARAFRELAVELASSPQTILQKLAEMALKLCPHADSAGISIAETADGKEVFRWHAVAGQMSKLCNGTMPRDFSPCGVVLDRNAAQLMREPVRYYDYLQGLDLDIHEVLLIPFHQNGQAVGTIWVIAHIPETKFDFEDNRILHSLAEFTAAAVQTYRLAVEAVEQRERLLSVLTQAPMPLAVLEGSEHRFSFTNPLYRQYFLGGAEAAGKTVEEMIPDAKAQGFIALLDQVYKTGQRYVGNETRFKFTGPDGIFKEFFFNFVYEPVHKARGQAEGILAAIVDVTEPVQARRKIEESETRYQLASRATREAIWDWNLLTNDVLWNEAIHTEYGYSREAMRGNATWWYEHVHSEDRERVVHGIHEVIDSQDGQHWSEEYRFKRANGEYALVLDRGSIVRNKQGKAVRMIGAMQDITERKLADESLRESKEFLRAAINSSAGGFYGVDRDGVTTVCNAAFLRMLGFEREKDAVGKKLHDVIHHAHPDGTSYPSTQCPIYRAAQTGTPAHVEDELFFRLDGTSFPVEYWTLPIIREGEVTGAVTTFIDITERKAAQEALSEALRSRDEFLSIASHELKTPITSLRLQLQMAKRRIKPELGQALSPEKLAAVIDMSMRQTDRLTELIEDLLDISRIQAGKLVFNFDELSVGEVIQEVVDRFCDQLVQARCPVEVHVVPKLVARWDRSRIEQVLVNLISNAIKYAPGAPIRISADMNKLGHVTLTVQDFGPGIPKTRHSRIFERFERATASRNISGLGLGLYIVKQIVEGHGGEIRVESEEGKGTKFIVMLPLSRGETGRAMPKG